MRQDRQPLAQQRVDLVGTELIADRLQRGRVFDGSERIVQPGEVDPGLRGLPLGPVPTPCNDGSSPPAASSISQGDTITVRLNRTYSPVLRHADIPDVAVRWWGGRRLHFQYH